MASRQPNVVIFFTDQQRWDTTGVHGNPMDLTPNFDRVAMEGTHCTNAFTCQPVCGPARACIQTGRYATEMGAFTNHRRLPAGERTLAHHLSDAGYEAGYIGKWHLASCGPRGGADDFRTRPVPPDRRGGYRDYWLASDVLEFTSHSYDGHMFDADGQRVEFPAGRYRADCVTDSAIEFLRVRSGKRPFFLMVSYIEPHHQNDHNRYEGPRGSKERFADYPVPGDLVDTVKRQEHRIRRHFVRPTRADHHLATADTAYQDNLPYRYPLLGSKLLDTSGYHIPVLKSHHKDPSYLPLACLHRKPPYLSG